MPNAAHRQVAEIGVVVVALARCRKANVPSIVTVAEQCALTAPTADACPFARNNSAGTVPSARAGARGGVAMIRIGAVMPITDPAVVVLANGPDAAASTSTCMPAAAVITSNCRSVKTGGAAMRALALAGLAKPKHAPASSASSRAPRTQRPDRHRPAAPPGAVV